MENMIGYLGREIKEVYKAEIDDEYNKTLKKLYDLKRQKHNKIDIENKTYENLYKILLLEAQKNDLVISIQDINFKDYICLIKEVNNNKILFISLNENGKELEEIEYTLDEIKKINCDSKDEQCIKLLHDN